MSTHPIEKRERLDSAAEGREAAAGGARAAQLEAEEVDDEQQEVRALGVPQELVAGASARVRALDDAGQVGHGDAAIVREAQCAELRTQRRDCPQAQQHRTLCLC